MSERRRLLHSPALGSPALGACPPRGEAGLSMIEVVIASLLFLFVVLGILPLFFRSAVSNAMGADSTQLSNLAKSRVEELSSLDFNDPQLAVEEGETVLETVAYWDPETKTWDDVAPSTAVIRFQRTTRVRQFSLEDLRDDGVLDTPLDGDESPSRVQIKEIEVVVQSFAGADGNGSGPVPGRRILVRALKTV